LKYEVISPVNDAEKILIQPKNTNTANKEISTQSIFETLDLAIID